MSTSIQTVNRGERITQVQGMWDGAIQYLFAHSTWEASALACATLAALKGWGVKMGHKGVLLMIRIAAVTIYYYYHHYSTL
eukprot:7224055-Prymnesium_polylepis.1